MNEDLFEDDAPALTHERLLEKLHYDPDTGLFTRRGKSRGRGKAGAVVGSVDSDGYVNICVDYVTYAAGRLAWFYVTGKWPQFLIDHQDGNTSNNRWLNLRDAPPSINSQNRHGPHRGKVRNLPLGVYPQGKRFRSSIMIDGAVTRLGIFDTAEEASAAYLEFRRANCPGNLL